jgi:uncharacterized membrane protein YdbT with pleckstrin-like domain
MSYVERYLTKDEKVIYETRLHWKILSVPAIVAIIFLSLAVFGLFNQWGLIVPAILFCIGVLPALIAYLRIANSEFAVTNRRVIIKIGILNIRSLEILRDKLEAIGVDQSIGGRILNYGTITINGTGGTKELFDGIQNPFEFRRAAQE